MNTRLLLFLFGGLFACGMLVGCKSMTPMESTAEAGNEVRMLIKENIADEAKAKQMIDLIDALEVDMKAFGEERSEINSALVAKNADYNASREDMQKLYDDLNKKSEAMARKIAQLNVDMHKLSTPEEWKLISKNKNRIGGL